MEVTIVDCTGYGSIEPSRRAAALLLFAKSTRLEMRPNLLDEIMYEWEESKLEEELDYVAKTIPSSWEFVNYTVLITGVTRAFTHQLVRTRTASFAQQTMRILNVNGWDYGTGPSIKDDDKRRATYDSTMELIACSYDKLIKDGAAIEDARGILPTNIHTNILMGANLRTYVELVSKRTSPRVQGEYRRFIEELKYQIEAMHPWTEKFFGLTDQVVCRLLDGEISKIDDKEQRTRMTKLVDKLRSS